MGSEIVCVFAISSEKSLCGSWGNRQFFQPSDSKQTNKTSQNDFTSRRSSWNSGEGVWAPCEWTWWCQFKGKWMTAGQHLQRRRCSWLVLGSVNAVKIQNRPPRIPEVYLWPIAVREKRNVGSHSGRNKGRNLKMWQADWQREIWGEESQETAGWSRWILAKVLFFLVSARWLPVQLILSRYPERHEKNVYFTTAYERKHLWKEAVVDIKYYTGTKCPDRCIHVNHYKKDTNCRVPSSRLGVRSVS